MSMLRTFGLAKSSVEQSVCEESHHLQEAMEKEKGWHKQQNKMLVKGRGSGQKMNGNLLPVDERSSRWTCYGRSRPMATQRYCHWKTPCNGIIFPFSESIALLSTARKLRLASEQTTSFCQWTIGHFLLCPPATPGSVQDRQFTLTNSGQVAICCCVHRQYP